MNGRNRERNNRNNKSSNGGSNHNSRQTRRTRIGKFDKNFYDDSETDEATEYYSDDSSPEPAANSRRSALPKSSKYIFAKLSAH
ncbi:hypothetical protein TKK_0004937 [Trichogramma kaykai]